MRLSFNSVDAAAAASAAVSDANYLKILETFAETCCALLPIGG